MPVAPIECININMWASMAEPVSRSHPTIDVTAVNAAITAALAAAGGAHNSTPEINAIQTAVNGLDEGEILTDGNFFLSWSLTNSIGETITQNQIKMALDLVLGMMASTNYQES